MALALALYILINPHYRRYRLRPALGRPHRAETRALLRLGYPRGVLQWLDAWAQRHPGQAALAQRWQALAREFRFEAIATALEAQPMAPAVDP